MNEERSIPKVALNGNQSRLRRRVAASQDRLTEATCLPREHGLLMEHMSLQQGAGAQEGRLGAFSRQCTTEGCQQRRREDAPDLVRFVWRLDGELKILGSRQHQRAVFFRPATGRGGVLHRLSGWRQEAGRGFGREASDSGPAVTAIEDDGEPRVAA
ncbi:MAG: hypothetical protein SX243_00590 [Acidobacteriota bacterium]|nr:hypothetical protein [Acidobacteriota bacterium]